MAIHNPLPSNLEAECRKCSKILASFVDPKRAFSADKIIPSSVLANAKGLVVLTVFKAGFLGSARYGNGVVVARLSDGTWSAPSAVGAGGAGFGGQIGIELTDFVFILNDRAAVRTFSQQGSLTMGGNVSVAAGPIGRNVEAAGAASLKSVAAIFSYSKTKGLFAGVSFEGSVIVERRDANERLYGRRYTAYQLLNGSVAVPPAAHPLLKVLNSRTFTGDVVTAPLKKHSNPPVNINSHSTHNNPRSTHNKQSKKDQKVGFSARRSAFRENFAKSHYGRSYMIERHSSNDNINTFKTQRSMENIKNDSNPKGKQTYIHRHSIDGYYGYKPNDNGSTVDISEDYNCYTNTSTTKTETSEEKKSILRPAIRKPMFPNLSKNQAIALETFEAERLGDLGFEKGDVITVTQSSGSKNDWWTGIKDNKTGIFPAKYVEMKNQGLS